MRASHNTVDLRARLRTGRGPSTSADQAPDSKSTVLGLGPMRPAYNGDEQSDASRHDRSSAEAPEHPGRVVVGSLEDHGGFGSARTVARLAGLRMSKKEAPRRALDHLAKGSRPWGQK